MHPFWIAIRMLIVHPMWLGVFKFTEKWLVEFLMHAVVILVIGFFGLH